ncbi:putative HNH homing endonuclease [Acinetobacter phage vB_AbM_WUPSU]|nr:putative HNH homing endonuclease [Acinetobacter phage vB_AbM_WUPSU]
MSKLVCGYGLNDKTRPSYINGVEVKEYLHWASMIKRCDKKNISKKFMHYIDCEVSDNFKNYSYFYDWCQEQIGFENKGWQLDKDLLIKGNKIYSEDTCVFIPKEINLLLTKRKNDRGEFPIGVFFEKKPQRFRAQISMHGKRYFLGYFDSAIEAFNVYKEKKESHIKYIAENYKEVIDIRAYNALISYNVEIGD